VIQSQKAPARDAVQQDLPHVLKFLKAIEPSLGATTLSEVIGVLDLATANDAALNLVVDSVTDQRTPARPGRTG
jgi:hypothetical protein